MQLDAIAGNERARAFLKRAVEEQRPSHAYLFVGPVGVGKTATALAFAADLLAAAGEPPATGFHPDLWVEDSDAESISIDTIRREGRGPRGAGAGSEKAAAGAPAQPLQAFLSLKGLRSDRRVAVMARAERLNETAATPLLKTIEEPPEGAVLILCAEAADLLPATIRSRCQELEFPPLSGEEMAAFARDRGLELEPAVLRLAQGCPGRALRLAEDPDEAQRLLGWAADLQAVPGGNWLDIVRLGSPFGTPDTARNRRLAKQALDTWEAWLRDLAHRRAAGSSEIWAAADLASILDIWESAREAADRVENNVNPRMAIEVFLADLRQAIPASG